MLMLNDSTLRDAMAPSSGNVLLKHVPTTSLIKNTFRFQHLTYK